MKRIVCALLALLCMATLCVTALAASADASLTGPDTVRAGDTITLTFSISGTGILGADGNLSYDENLLELKEIKQKVASPWMVELNGNRFVTYDNNQENPINENTALFTVTFKVKSNVATGTKITVSCVDVAISDGRNETKRDAVNYSVSVAAPKSGDNTLKSLAVSNATLSPAFNAATTAYTAEVPFEVEKLDVKAEANDSKAKVSVNNPTLTPGGTTNVTITVTAENGDNKTYTIAVKRAQDPNYAASSNNDLAGITVDGFLLSPVFSAENDQYVIWLPYETENVSVSGTASDSKASVTVEGGSGLIAGADNEIKVICTAEDGTQKVYTIIAKRAAAHDDSTEPTVPSTEPTEPSTEPSEPGVESTEPATTPTEPQDPVDTEKKDGISWWILLIACVVCFAGGMAAGIFVDKKGLSKK